ncbi:MAG: hypothetical protein HJJLKODD_00053 [Phycisphaerae bacterium]|nr:hypothetical protein [Phycisphaerae bacterium]
MAHYFQRITSFPLQKGCQPFIILFPYDNDYTCLIKNNALNYGQLSCYINGYK